MKKLIQWCSIALLATSCTSLNKKFGLSDDNIIEEVAEDVIDREFGVQVDLTPASPESQ